MSEISREAFHIEKRNIEGDGLGPSKSPDKTQSVIKRLRTKIFLPLKKEFPEFIQRCEFRKVQSHAEFKLACHLVYLEYRRKQYSLDNENQLRLSIYQLLKKSTTFIVMYKKKYIIATMTLVEDTPLGLPMDKLYRGEVNLLRKTGNHCGEATMLAMNNQIFDKANISKSLRMLLLMRLFNSIFTFIRKETSINMIVACFHPRHALFYQAMYFQPLGALKSYEQVQGSPALAFYLDIPKTREEACPDRKDFFGLMGSVEGGSPEKRISFKFEDFGEMFIRSAE